MQDTSSSFQLRLNVELWGSSYLHSHARGRCVVSPEQITVSTGDCEHVHRHADIVELRWWLGASLVVISKTKGKPLRPELRYSDAGVCAPPWPRAATPLPARPLDFPGRTSST